MMGKIGKHGKVLENWRVSKLATYKRVWCYEDNFAVARFFKDKLEEMLIILKGNCSEIAEFEATRNPLGKDANTHHCICLAAWDPKFFERSGDLITT